MSARKQQVKDSLMRQGFLPIYVHDTMDSHVLVDGAVEAGCTVLEYTCRRQDAATMIPWIKKHHPQVAVLGATMIDGPRSAAFLARHRKGFLTVDQMVDLGVDGLVSFLRFREETYQRHAQRLIFIAGAGTSNEALDQLELGADFVKIAVSSPEGERLITTSRVGTHALMPIMATSGITVDRVDALIKAGVALTSAGFDLIFKQELAQGTAITSEMVVGRVRAYLEAMGKARQVHQSQLWQAIQTQSSNLVQAGGWVC